MFVLILGSYDSETKQLLYSLRDCLTSKFVKEGHYFVIMEKMTLFRTEDGKYVLNEEDTENNVTLYIFNSIRKLGEVEAEMIDTIKLQGGLEETVSKYITDLGELPTRIQMDKASITGEGGLFNFLVEICSFYNVIIGCLMFQQLTIFIIFLGFFPVLMFDTIMRLYAIAFRPIAVS
jgi:hypothetical protein